jgi:hypothetical protein
MVREGSPNETEGSLSLHDEVLAFEPAGPQAKLEVPRKTILKAHRSRGTPVLNITFDEGEGPTRLFFYFAKPPPLPGERPVTPMPLFRPPRGMERSAAALSLRATNRLLKREIEAWVEALSSTA